MDKLKSLAIGSIVALAAAGCATDALLEEQEAELQAARQEISVLEARLEALRAETRRLEALAAPEAAAKRRAELERDLAKYGLRVTSRGPELVVTLADTVLFGPGEVAVRKEAKPSLLALAKAVRERFPDRSVRIEGHTDSSPPKRTQDKFPTNWELSAARALAVLRLMVEEGGFPRDRISAAAYGQHRPIRDNSTPEGREENRRVDIVILPAVEANKLSVAELMP